MNSLNYQETIFCFVPDGYYINVLGNMMFRYTIFLLLPLLFISCIGSPGAGDKEKRVLIFSKTDGYRHDSIPFAKAALAQICAQNGIAVDTTEDASAFNEHNLKRYSAIVFLNTVGNIFDEDQKQSFQRYIQAGGGFVGIHSATGTQNEWPWFGKMVGGYFVNHPKVQKATIHVVNREHPATQHLPARWERTDEWYNFRDLNPDVTVLATLDETTYTGGEHPDYHPIAWCQEYDGGRAFYTALGHLTKNYQEPDLLKHMLGGIQWAIGNNRLDYGKVAAVK
ncbi:Crp/FNR family transcriptional regulator [Flammeovirgaceae bacterium 311]|nr:Crp/FNR family transcriptional regulator [Flammeovirgaceae bacterium 311]